jgi:hypothetical protein
MMLLFALVQTKLFWPGTFFMISAILGTVFLVHGKARQKVSFKVFAIYSILCLLFFGLVGLLGFLPISSLAQLFVICQAFFIILGIWHYFQMTRLIRNSQSQDNFLQELLFTAYVSSLGIFAFLTVFAYSEQTPHQLQFVGGQLMFFIPFLLISTASAAVDIPPKVYSRWYYPSDPSMMEVPDSIWENPSKITLIFELTRSMDTTEAVLLRVQAPGLISMGLLFANSLADWNDRSPGNQILAHDNMGIAYGWNFYLESKSIFQGRQYLDPELSIRENGLSESDRVIAVRVG